MPSHGTNSGTWSCAYCPMCQVKYYIHTFLLEKVHDWVEDYVLLLYETGAVMAGPTYDKQGYEFFKKCNLCIKWVVK
jgi:leucyl-tRNA synthetase